ncbi:two-CW domain-containing protein [Thermodesulfobacteriota bacterium]
MKKNCWEEKNCGREVGGTKVEEMGVCPAASDAASNGVNDGKNGGRICWAVVGTFCGGKKQGTFAEKRISCMSCEFYKKVFEEEAESFELMRA